MQTARVRAIEALCAVFGPEGLKPKAAHQRASEGLDRRDRAFLMEVLYGVIRHRDTLDWILKDFLKSPSRLSRFTLNNLRASAYQIFHMDVPPFAIVNEAVSAEDRRTKALVNAVLRGMLRNVEQINKDLAVLVAQAKEPSLEDKQRAGAISRATSHPLWLVRRWVSRFGADEAYALAMANNAIPPLTLRVNELKANRDDVIRMLREHGIPCEPTAHSPEGIRLNQSRHVIELPALREICMVQDEAAQLISHMLAPKPGQRVLDACAAPGGKATHIAQLMGDTGEVVAVDIDDSRIELMRQNISNMGLASIEVLNADITDAADKSIGEEPFDLVLLDAPCSATGVIRRNPDVKYRHKADDLQRFRQKQLALLGAVACRVAPGGELLYCTCSTEPEEGEEAVKGFLKTSADFIMINECPEILVSGWQSSPCSEGFLRTFPHRHEMDGFFAARLKKVAGGQHKKAI